MAASRSPDATGSRFTFFGLSGLVWTAGRAIAVNPRWGQIQIVPCKNWRKRKGSARSDAIIGNSVSRKRFMYQRLAEIPDAVSRSAAGEQSGWNQIRAALPPKTNLRSEVLRRAVLEGAGLRIPTRSTAVLLSL